MAIDPTEVLLALMGVAVTLIGFTGAVVALTGEHKGTTAAGREFRIHVLVLGGSGAVFVSFLPVLLLALGVSPSTVWAALSVLSAVLLLAFLAWGMLRQRKLFGACVPRGSGWTDGSMIAAVCLCCIFATANAIGWQLHREFAGYLITIFPWFYVSILVFFRTLLDSPFGSRS